MTKKFTSVLWALLLMVSISGFSQNAAPACYQTISGEGVQVGTVGTSGGLCVSQFCLGPGYTDLQKVIDADLNSASSYTSLGTLINSNGLSVKNHNQVYPAGYVAGYVFSSGQSLLSLSMLNGFRVATYLNGVLQEEKIVSSLVSTTILASEQKQYATFTTTKQFDEVRLRTAGINANVLNTIKVYGALAFSPDCATANYAQCDRSIAGPNTDVTFNGAAVCAACNLSGGVNLIDGTKANYAGLSTPASILSSPSVGVINRGLVYPAGYSAGFVVSNSNGTSLIGASFLNSVTVETYLFGQLQESGTFTNGTSAGVLSLKLLSFSDGQRNKIGFKTAKRFNEVRFRQSQVASIQLAVTKIYYAYAEPGDCVDCNIYLGSATSGKYTGALVQNQLFSTYTGTYGFALHSLSGTSNVISAPRTDYAQYNHPFIVSALSGAKVTAKNSGTLFPAGSFAGYEISQQGSLINADFLSSITIRTYRVSGNSITKVEENVGSISLLGLDLIGGNTQKAKVGFKTTKPFNAIQIDISNGLLQGNLGGQTRIFGAYVFEDADNDGVGDCIDVCPNGDDRIDTDFDGIPDACDVCKVGETAPILAGGTVTNNICPATTAILPGLSATEQAPQGAQLTWHYGPTATINNRVPNPQAVTTGVYYAAFFDPAGNCYSTNTTRHEVKTFECQPDLQPEFVFGDGYLGGNTPTGMGIRVRNLNGQASSGPITVTIDKDVFGALGFTFNPTATSINVLKPSTDGLGNTTYSNVAVPVNNSAWTFAADASGQSYVMTSSAPIAGFGSSVIGLAVTQEQGNAIGFVTLLATVADGSGGELNNTNNLAVQPILLVPNSLPTGRQTSPVAAAAVENTVSSPQAIGAFPNPTRAAITFNGVSKGSSIDIVNVSGRSVKSFVAGTDSPGIDISGLASGVYVGHIRNADGTYTSVRIIKTD